MVLIILALGIRVTNACLGYKEHENKIQFEQVLNKKLFHKAPSSAKL